MLNLSQYSVTKIPISPMATLKQYLGAIQLLSPFTFSKDPKTSENHKEPRMKRSQTTQHKNTKPQNHKNNNNNNKNSHHWQLSYRSPYAKPAKNAWEVLIDDTQAVNEETMETYHQHLLKVADQPQNIHTSKPEKKN